MKKHILGMTLAAGLGGILHAQIATVDGAALQQRELHHVETVFTLNQIIANQRDQLATLNRQLDELLHLDRVIGDPAQITSLPGIEVPLSAAHPMTNAASPVELRGTVQATLAQLDSGNGIFTVIGEKFTTLDGVQVARDALSYKPVAAVIAASASHDQTFGQVTERRQQLREAARQTLEQLRIASTDSETLKLLGVLEAEHLELDAVDRDLQFAAQQAQMQDLDNRNDQQRQAIARTEEQAMEIHLAIQRLAESLKPDTQPVKFGTPP